MKKKLMILVIFDVDGTLVYSERRDSQCFADTYVQLYGRPFPGIDWEHYPHVTDTAIFSTAFDRHFQRIPEEHELERFREEYVALLLEKRRLDPDHSREVPGARQALELLQADGRFILGVATGGWRRPAELKLRHIGIPVDRLLIEGADGRPTREDILEALISRARHARHSIDRVVYVGDALWDVRTTRNLGLNFIGIRWQGDFEVLRQAGASVVLRDYLDYPAFLAAVHYAAPPGEGRGGELQNLKV